MGITMRGGRSEVTQPITFAQETDEQHIQALSEHFPKAWSQGQRDRVESLGNILWYAREGALYRKFGCASWEEYCDKYYRVPYEAFDELIAGVRILQGKGFSGPISETQAREVGRFNRTQPQAARELGESVAASAKQGRPKKGQEKGSNTTFSDRGAAYRAANLKRDHPEVAARMAAGEFRSVAEAERAAGIVTKTDDIKSLCRLYRRSSPEQWAAIVAWVIEHEEPYNPSL